jgi:hypothetical protein
LSDRESHCPFLNKSDVRCGSHFSLTKLGRAFDHCFGCYAACTTYQEMLIERQDRRQHGPRGVNGGMAGTLSHGAMSHAAIPQLVTVRLPAGHAHQGV